MKRTLCLICLILSVTAADAGDICRGRTTYATYVAPVYHAPYNYENIVLVPKAIKVEVQREHYYSVNASVRDDLLADAIVGRLLRLRPNQGGVPATGESPPVGAADTDSGETRAGPFQDPELLKVLSDSCIKCHGVNSKYTKLITPDGKIPDLKSGKVWECFALVNSGEMPKGGTSIPDAGTKKFYEWGKKARK